MKSVAGRQWKIIMQSRSLKICEGFELYAVPELIGCVSDHNLGAVLSIPEEGLLNRDTGQCT